MAGREVQDADRLVAGGRRVSNIWRVLPRMVSAPPGNFESARAELSAISVPPVRSVPPVARIVPVMTSVPGPPMNRPPVIVESIVPLTCVVPVPMNVMPGEPPPVLAMTVFGPMTSRG